MKVIFRQSFFGPNGSRYRPKVEYEVPDEWKLPKSATIIDKDGKSVEVVASAAAGSTSKGVKL